MDEGRDFEGMRVLYLTGSRIRILYLPNVKAIYLADRLCFFDGDRLARLLVDCAKTAPQCPPVALEPAVV